jgi:hypothetical protein
MPTYQADESFISRMRHATHNPFYYFPLHKTEGAIDAEEAGKQSTVLLYEKSDRLEYIPSISRFTLICSKLRLGSAALSGLLKELGMDR